MELFPRDVTGNEIALPRVVVYNGALSEEDLLDENGGVVVDERQPCKEPGDWSLGDLSVGVLEEILIDLMIVKYPGVEQADTDRLLAALRKSDLSLVSKIEADIAEKSAKWMRAILNVDR